MLQRTTASLAMVLTLASFGASSDNEVGSHKAVFDHYPGIGYLRIMWTTYNWTNAYSFCQQLGAELAVPNSDAEGEVYRRMIATLSASPANQELVYIGFHDRFVPGEYETVHDTPMSLSGYTRWAMGYPDGDPDHRCGGFSKDGGLRNVPCSNSASMSFICEQPSWLGYELFEGVGYYDMRVKGATWVDAWKSCRDDGAHLAVINGVEEHRVLQQLFRRHPFIPEADSDIYAWVGVHSGFGFNDFRTVVGTSLADAGYTTWENGYPANTIHTSVYAGLKNNNGSLILLPPEKRMAYFCEHEL